MSKRTPRPRKTTIKAKEEKSRLHRYYDRTNQLWSQYNRRLLTGLAAIGVIVAAIFIFKRQATQSEQEAAFQELMIRDAYSRGSMEEALQKAEEVLNSYAGTSAAATALTVKGKIYQQRGDYPFAMQAYQQLIAKYSDQPYLAFGGYLSLGDIYYGQKDYGEAARYYQRAAEKFPHHFNAPVALLKAGQAWRKINHYDDAKRALRLTITKYPKSRATSEARDVLAEIEFLPGD